MEKLDTSNEIFSLASDLVHFTSRNIFLTGKAGTGKTSFLKYIRENCPKQMVVVAPTGVAAINAGGVTIHSFFQLPFSPFIPGNRGFIGDKEVSDRHSLISRLRFNSDRLKIFRELELLVIDEISMVRCDVLDAIDLVLRHVRHKQEEKFGGVQVILIGDMFQLPPVVKEQEWNLLGDYYGSPYFFDSHVLKDDLPVYVEFTKIYRQTEEKFINLLNRVRNNEMDAASFAALDQRYDPEFFSGGTDGYILLTTHNEIARNMNARELQKLPREVFTYKAEVDMDFPPSAFPADEVLNLKIGAQVMFIRNDAEKGKRYFNGKIGVVTQLNNDVIEVQCKGDDFSIEVKREKWENIRYTLNKTTRQLDEDLLGTFSQFPLRLAWAITIHKSQGLTFEKAVIDAGEAFAPGQVYVALSRCTSLDGLVLHSKVKPGRFCVDERIVKFSRSIKAADVLQQELEDGRKIYEEKVLVTLFDLGPTVNEAKELVSYLLQAGDSFNPEAKTWGEGLFNMLASLNEVAAKFQLQLRRLFSQAEVLEENMLLQERLAAAVKYFLSELKKLSESTSRSPAVTDSRLHAKEFNESVREIFSQLALKVFLLEGIAGKFDLRLYHERKKSFVLPAFPVNAYAVDSDKKVDLSHPALYYQLKKLRDSICSKRNMPVYLVASSKTLEEMATYLPASLEELEEISGFGKVKVQSFGNEFMAIIQEYAKEKNLSSTIALKRTEKKARDSRSKKSDTKAASFKLFEMGKTVAEIAAERGLTISTVEGHLVQYVQSGDIPVEKLVTAEQIRKIEPVVRNGMGKTLTEIKNELGDDASYSEIRFVLASIQFHSKSPAHIDH